jgi:hypothetical protein
VRGLELALEVDVERDQRPTRADEDRSGGLVKALGAEVRPQVASVDPTLQLIRTAAPEERGPAARGELAVQEDREAEVVADSPRQLLCGVPRTRHVIREDRHDGDHVGGADPRMSSFVTAQVDPLPGARDRREQRVHEVALLADEREDRTVVIDVGVDVQQLGALTESRSQRVQRWLLAALGEVRHRFER